MRRAGACRGAYLEKLIRKGFRVAVCEQVEDPAEAKKRGSKSVVKREVIRLVTPGTLTEDSLLEARASNMLAALGAQAARFRPRRRRHVGRRVFGRGGERGRNRHRTGAPRRRARFWCRIRLLAR